MGEHHARIVYLVECDACDYMHEVGTIGEGSRIAEQHERNFNQRTVRRGCDNQGRRR